MTFRIPLMKPYVDENIIERVNEVLRSGYLTEGPVTKKLERTVADYVSAEHAIAFTSNTVGMEIALRALGIGEGDEVVIPGYTHPATANVVKIVGAEPILVDVDKNTANIDYEKIKDVITPRVKAIIPVSLFGNPLDYDALRQIMAEYGIRIVEDAACSIGASFDGEKIGSFADITVFSFHPRKFITTGEGGMATTNDTELAKFMRGYKHFGMEMVPDGLIAEFGMVGTNSKLSNILAAVGLGQMDIIDDLLERRIERCEYYKELLKNVDHVEVLEVTPKGKASYQSFGVKVLNRNFILRGMRELGIEVQIGSYAIHLQPAFRNLKRNTDLSNSEYLFDHCLVLPLHDELSKDQQREVVDTLEGFVNS